MKKLVSILLAALLVASALPLMAGAEGDPLTLTVLQPLYNNFDPAETEVQKAYIALLSKELGRDVTLDYTYYGAGTEYKEKINMAVNAADLTWDLISIGETLSGSDGTFQGCSALYNSLGKEGFFVNLMAQDMPNLKARLESLSTVSNYIYTADGELYFAPQFTENQEASTLNAGRRGPIIDKTVFDENGIAYPTSLDELYAAAKQLKEIYPDSVPIIPMSTGIGSLMARLDEMAFSTRWAGNLGFDGTQYVLEGVTDDFREMMIYGHRCYAEGLVAADYAAWDKDMMTAATVNGNSFIFLNMWSTIEPDYSLTNTNYGVPGHEYLNIAYAMAVNDGGWWEMRGAMKEISAVVGSAGVMVVNAMSDKVEDACKVLDVTYGEEAHNLLALGIQGKSWDYDEDGNKVYINEYAKVTGTTSDENPRIALGMQITGACSSGLLTLFNVTNTNGFGEETYMPFLMPDGTITMSNPYIFARDMWTYDVMEPENSVDVALPVLTAEEYEEMNELTAPLYTYIKESMAKFYTGELDPNDDAVWQTYLDGVYRYDVDRLCELYNQYIEGVDFYND